MVSNASEDLPEPLRPVITVRVLRGISTLMFLRLCWRAPRTVMLVIPMNEFAMDRSGDSGRGETQLYSRILFANIHGRQREVKLHQNRWTGRCGGFKRRPPMKSAKNSPHIGLNRRAQENNS